MNGMLLDHSRPNVFEIDLDAIAANVLELRRFVGPEVRIFAAMKANGYGFGLVEVAAVLQQSGVDAVCVADLSDAARLRGSGISLPILLYGGNLVDATFVRGIEELDLWATITDIEVARSYSLLARSNVTVFLKVDVGLERLGVPVEDAADVLCDVLQLPQLRLEGIYTHVHVPSGTDTQEYVHWELARFAALLEEMRKRGVVPPVAMAASTPVLPIAGACGLNGIDVGRLIYGSLRSDRDSTGPMRIRNAFKSVRSRLIQCKAITRTEYLSEAPFPIRPGMRMGIVPMGYGDGLDSLNCGYALVRGRRVPLLAGPSLEHTRLDLTEVPEARVGDEVVFVGTQDGAEVTLDEVLEHLGFEQPARMAAAVRDSVRRVYSREQK
jgi:alanine racemase